MEPETRVVDVELAELKGGDGGVGRVHDGIIRDAAKKRFLGVG